MKNIHILLTDKPSRIVKNTNNQIKLTIQTLPKDLELGCYPQYIYITSDEKIKEGGWHFNLALNLVEKTTSFHNGLLCEKIILTTDPQLIANGIQEIDETFLGWFVKNPSCESIVVESYYRVKSGTIQEHKDGIAGYEYYEYKIIIPQEEPKQETLEEAAIKYATNHGMMAYVFPEKRESFIDGAKWQAERMYSEEDIKQAYLDGCRIKLTNPYHLDKWFEQFKKK
jgi:hypothetical protein